MIKLGEQDLTIPVLSFLYEENLKGNYCVTTSDIRYYLRKNLTLSHLDRMPLVHRTDEVIDQIIRNIVCHRDDSKNNIIHLSSLLVQNGKAKRL